MIVKIYLVNVFTDGPFSGGRAAAVIMRRLARAETLQSLAAELGAPATAYILPYPDGFAVRYFSPAGELRSGGYAALAAAKAIYGSGLLPPDRPAVLGGRTGPVEVRPGDLEDGLGLILPAVSPPPANPPDWFEPSPAEYVFYVFEDNHLLVCCSAPPEAAWAAAAAAKAPEGAILSFSFPQEDGCALRSFNSSGELAELPLDIEVYALLAGYWSEKLGRPRLEIRRPARRPALMWAAPASGGVELSGRLKIIYRAEPVCSDLLTDDIYPPGR